MQILFKCPECGKKAVVELSDEEAESIKDRILNEGRSPTLIVHCESNHELLVTLYNLRSGDGLGVRDVVVPHRASTDDDDREVDWLARAFGGDT